MKNKLIDLLTGLKAFKFVKRLAVEFKKHDIDNAFESIYTTVISNMRKSIEIIDDTVLDHNINILMYNPSASSSYFKLPKELDQPKKGLINIKNIDDDECGVSYVSNIHSEANNKYLKSYDRKLESKHMYCLNFFRQEAKELPKDGP